jgi:ABC-type transporter Mla MlaB component
MFRISTVKAQSHTTITVDGQLMSDSVETVESCCDEEISAGKPVELLLRDLTTIDQAGRALLCRL